MPEGPEVRCFSDALKGLLDGGELRSLKVDSKSRYGGKNKLANLSKLNQALPLKIERVWSKGKKIIFDLGDIALVSSLGLEGKWSPNAQKHSNLWLVYTNSEGDKSKVYFDDSRHHGLLEIIVGKDNLETRLDKIGPDLLDKTVSKKAWLKVYRQRLLADKEICFVMMEQKFFSGIGNYIKAMSLYEARIRPDALIKDLKDEDLLKLRKYVLIVIRGAYAARGATIRTYKDFDGNRGDFEVKVYGKKEDSKGRKVIVTIHTDGRSTHWVPEKQTIPSPWTGPVTLDKKKLKRSINRGTDTYKVTELRGLCKQYEVGQSGNKSELVERLLKLV
jgi:formamidopyrimidine-DNA glycosylase